MSIVEALQSLGGVGVFVGAVAYALKERSRAMRIRAEAERNESERSVADGANLAGALEEVRKANEALRSATDALQKAREEVHALKLWAQRVVTEMRRRNMTPPEMPAVLLDTEEA
jgi:hypothetical protein